MGHRKGSTNGAQLYIITCKITYSVTAQKCTLPLVIFNTLEPCFYNCNSNDINSSLLPSLSTDLGYIHLPLCCPGLQPPEMQGLYFPVGPVLGNSLKGVTWTQGWADKPNCGWEFRSPCCAVEDSKHSPTLPYPMPGTGLSMSHVLRFSTFALVLTTAQGGRTC